MGKARGSSLVEVLIALSISLVVVTALMRLFSLSVAAFERNEDITASAAQSSAEKVLAFLNLPLRHCGVGLPERWEKDLFTALLNPIAAPSWSLWGGPVAVGSAKDRDSFSPVPIGQWGNALRVVYGVPRGSIVIDNLTLRASQRVTAALSDGLALPSSSINERKTTSWLLFPGTAVPAFVTANSMSDRPSLRALRDSFVPWGTAVYSLMALQLTALNGMLYGNFHDDSGAQPLIGNLESVQFRLEENRKALQVRIKLLGASGREMEVRRLWRIGL